MARKAQPKAAVEQVDGGDAVAAVRRAEADLRLSQERFDHVIAATSDGIYDWEVATDDLFISTRLADIFGFKPGELTSRDWYGRVHPEDREHYRDAITDYLRKGGQRLDEPVAAAIRCALKMVEASTGIDPGWTVRAGIHFGPVVAGIVGRRQFLFDLWGDTVNVAARVLDHAPPGAVVVSNETWLHARDACRGRSLGQVVLKGKGEVELIQCTAP